MNKRSILFIAGGMFGLASIAAPLTPDQALARIKVDGPQKVSAHLSSGPRLVYTAETDKGVKGAYLFEFNGGGYMILSADDVASPILGYSDNGRIDASNISPELKWWMDEYSRQIEWAAKNNRPAYKSVATRAGEEKSAIAPLVKTKWNQDAPYNDQCPIPTKVNGVTYTGGQRAYTGCVATAMAQVMNYHKYPENGVGMIQYTPKRNGYTFDQLTWNLERHPFEWDKMLDVYVKGEYTDEEADAVSNLMKSCGVSVEMSYGLDASGASGMDIAKAFRNYFNYDQNCRSESRNIYSSQQWEDMIYDNLKNVGPVVINGQSPSNGGHSFVCDGYDGNGYFHFNWGWGGMSDGYYLLQALNPDAQGIGGYAGGFNFAQNAIIGAQAPKGDNKGYDFPVRVLQYGAATASVSNSILIFNVENYSVLGWGNTGDRTMNCNIGAIFTKVDDTQFNEVVEGYMSNGVTKIETLTLQPSNYYSPDVLRPRIPLPTLSDGKYVVTLASYDNDCNVKEWLPVASVWGYPNYIYLTVENGNYKVENVPVAKLILNSVEITTELYYGRNFRIKANITNPSDLELIGYYSPGLYNGSKIQYSGESVGITVGAGETIDYEWISRFAAASGSAAPTSATTLTLGMFNPDYYAKNEVYGYFGQVTINPSPSTTLRMSATSFEIEGEKGTVNVGGFDRSVTYVKDANDINAHLEYRDIAGFFDGQMKLSVEKNVPGSNSTITVIDEVASQYPFLSGGESSEMNAKFAIPDAEENALYTLRADYTLFSQWRNLSSVYFIIGDESGVEDIEITDDNSEAVYYNLLGKKIDTPQPGEIVIVKRGNNVSKQIWK
ncbi:MAG: hypothetical protein HDS97_02360 [Bacteroidales bacterium]|nr:hypothetical protein [Bacteroidales bacterium]MBD5273899.1 hypothetical protein [Bacteroides sp.]